MAPLNLAQWADRRDDGLEANQQVLVEEAAESRGAFPSVAGEPRVATAGIETAAFKQL